MKRTPPHSSDLPPVDFSAEGLAVDFSFVMDDAPAVAPKSGKRPKAAEALGLSARLRNVTHCEKRAAQDLITHTEALEHVIRLPLPGSTVHLILPGTYTGFDLIAACQTLLARPMEIQVATLSMNQASALRLAEMLDAGTVTRAALILSEYFAGADADQFHAIRDALAARGAKVVACRNHAKVTILAARNPPEFITIEGSGNLRSCNSIEQAAITNDRQLYHFHRQWIDHVLATQKTA